MRIDFHQYLARLRIPKPAALRRLHPVNNRVADSSPDNASGEAVDPGLKSSLHPVGDQLSFKGNLLYSHR
jgi:hypothetical protein